MTRVALVPSAYLPSLGGVEELTRNLAASLISAGDGVEIWVQHDDARPGGTVDVVEGVTVRRFPFPLPRSELSSLGPVALTGARTMAGLRRAVSIFEPDVINVHCFGPNGVYGTALSILTRVPLVVSLHGETVMDDQDIFDTSTTLRRSLRVALRHAAAVTGCSSFTLRDAETRFGLRSGGGTVIFGGVGPDEPLGGSITPVPDGRYVLALGRIVAKKGFDLLVREFASVAARHDDVRLVVGGAGPAEGELRRLVDELGLASRVSFPGRLSRAGVAALMAGAEAVVVPSRIEPFGMVILESWRAGRATIVTSRGGPPEFVEHGRTGLVVDPLETGAIAAAVDRVLDDPALAQRLGDAARARVGDFDWTRVASRFSDVYGRVLDRS